MLERLLIIFPGAEVASGLIPRSGYTVDATVVTKLNEQLLLEGYSTQTRKAYHGHSLRFLKFIAKDPVSTGPEEIRKYFLYLLNDVL